MAYESQKKIGVRWSPGWTAIPSAIIRATGISRSARLLWCVLATFAGNDELAWPTQEQIASLCAEPDSNPPSRMSVYRWTQELVKGGWLTIFPHREGHEYELHEPKKVKKPRPTPSNQERRRNTHVTSDVTPMLHQGNAHVTSDVTPESPPPYRDLDLKHHHHANTQTHDPESDAADAAGGGGDQEETETERYLRETVGAKSAKARTALADLPLAAVQRRWTQWQRDNPRGGAGAFIEDLKASPPDADEPASAVVSGPVAPYLDPAFGELSPEERNRRMTEYSAYQLARPLRESRYV